jgi:GTPase SAR1 family protein
MDTGKEYSSNYQGDFREFDVIMLCYDVTNEASFSYAVNFYESRLLHALADPQDFSCSKVSLEVDNHRASYSKKKLERKDPNLIVTNDNNSNHNKMSNINKEITPANTSEPAHHSSSKIIFVGCKNDLSGARKVSRAMVERRSQNWNVLCIETSAKHQRSAGAFYLSIRNFLESLKE